MFDNRPSPALSRLPAEAAALLARLDAPVGAAPPLCPAPPLALARGRMHELTGPARRTLAALLAGAAQAEGPVLWLRPGWRGETFCPQGLTGLADPGALLFAACPRAEDILWAAEEALRAGSVALVVAEFAVPPDLRQLRRLHLAAAEGVARNRTPGAGDGAAPLGLLLDAERAESRVPGVESRWALHPLPPPAGWRQAAPPPDAWRLERLHARAAPPAAWRMRLEGPGKPVLEALAAAP